jgi:hypothetical protein
MFPNLLSSTQSFSFPNVSNIGTNFQVIPDSTQAILRFTGNGFTPTSSTLNVQQSVGGGGPWATFYGNNFVLNGTPLADFPVDLPGPYFENNFFRYRWENVALSYVGPWQTLPPPTTKLRWDVTTAPIAPTDVISATWNPLDETQVFIEVQHSLLDTLNYSNKGVYLTATINYSNGLQVVEDQYYLGWGASTVIPEVYTMIVPNRAPLTIVNIPTASAQYYVLGDPLPGILGSIMNL